MTFTERLEWLAQQAKPAALAACGALILLPLEGGRRALWRRAERARETTAKLEEIALESSEALSEASAQNQMRVQALASFKKGLPKLTESRRALYLGGLQLQEEKRLLEKQLEIMNTYLLVDEESRKVHVMRGEQSLESYPVQDAPPRAYGSGSKPPVEASAIVSKERFAHPERPKSDQVGGQLQWQPPQVGTSARANALGEYVVFTKGSLILHGPPKKPEEHAAFPHYCLGLSLPVARRLYNGTYIGTKITLKPRFAVPR